MSALISARAQAERPPLAPVVSATAVAVVITAALCCWAVLTAPASIRTPMAWCGGAAALALTVAVATAARERAVAHFHRARARALTSEADELARRTLPELIAILRDGTSPERALDRLPQSTVPAFREVTHTLAVEVGRGERMRAAALTACGNAASRVQALTTSILADLREMENRADEESLGGLLHIDHLTSQTGRLADSIAVITGSRTGRRWNKPIVMESILRGAMGRISSYRRIRLHNTSNRAVAGHAAEGVMHALAEIMDNAAVFSPPNSEVHVYVEETQSGLIVTVEDSGLVMGERQLRQAEDSVSAKKLDYTTMPGTRLGLTVVGCLARKHRLRVSFRPSARGGTGVVVIIPRQLVTDPPQDKLFYQQTQQQEAALPLDARSTPATTVPDTVDAFGWDTTPAPARRPSLPQAPHPAPSSDRPAATPPAGRPAAGGTTPAPPNASETTGTQPVRYGASGLPMRRRGQTLRSAAGRQSTTPPTGSAPRRPIRSNKENADRFRAFRKAVQGDTDGRGFALGDAARAEGEQPRGLDDGSGSAASTLSTPPVRPEDDAR
ncbi:ATP-binding protein [Streptomyces sp. NPDC059740]|uniref:ATP-binding protein n=1 Tax=Streptomyces sp. NPDC059740 TaxID=3346926 RepID=UPI0036606284